MRPIEQQFQILPQMVDACYRGLAIVFGFRENERPLDCGLRVERETLCGPVRMQAMLVYGLLDVGNERSGVLTDTAIASLAYGRVRVVDLLHHRAARQVKSGRSPCKSDLR